MSLRQRAAKSTVLPLQGSNGHNNNNGNRSDHGSTFSPRLKGKRIPQNSSVFLKAYLPIMCFFTVVMGCSYLAMGGNSYHDMPQLRHHASSTMKEIYRSSRKLTGEMGPNDDEKKRSVVGGGGDSSADTGTTPQKRDVPIIKDNTNMKDWLDKQKEKLELERNQQEEVLALEKLELELERKRQEKALEKERRELEAEKQVKRREMMEEEHPEEFKYRADDWKASCEQEAREKLKKEGHSPEVMMQLFEDLASCVEETVADKLIALNQEISYQSKTRLQVGAQLENYTCADPNAPTAEDVSSHVWHQGDGKSRLVHVKLDRPASRIHVVENFIDEEECAAMEHAAQKSLHKATVADGKGGSRYSENRKAMQAGIRVPWHEESKGNAIARLSRRVYDYTNHVLDVNVDEHGQEDLMSIQYFGRGLDDVHPDRYMPHCDGDCSGLPFHNGTRFATMVMYCTLPTRGGSTNFQNAGVHVKPQKGSAIFFSYMDPKTFVTDDRFTEHSGCPVYEGEKKIVTQWIRLGVDNENPWTSFNTLGIKMREASQYE